MTSTASRTTPSNPPPPPPPYISTADAGAVADRLAAARSVVVTTHAKPDGDAAGSALALTRALLACGIAAEAWMVGPFPTWLTGLTHGTPVRRLNPDQPDGLPKANPDVAAVVDTGAWSQLEVVRPWLEPRSAGNVIIDHHLYGNITVAQTRLIDPAAAATTEVLAPVIDRLLGLSANEAMPVEIAEALYLGLATDTGFFRFSNVRPNTLRLAARLLDSGVDHAKLYEAVEQQHAAARPRLLGRALCSLEMHKGNTVATMSIRKADMAETEGEDTGGFAEQPLAVASVRVVAIFTETTKPGDPKPLTKVSLRSKPGANAVDVAAIASRLGGGGHARAAGIKLNMPLEEAKRVVLAELV